MLRIISGSFKGLRIKDVGKDITRPTTDKNKEMIFNILGQYFESGNVLDLFAGSGSLGIEAISRGMSFGVFVDLAYEAIKTIKENLKIVNLLIPKDALVVKQDAISYLTNENQVVFDLIFIDPPYKLDLYEKALTIIENKKFLSDDGIIVLESDKERIIAFDSKNLKNIREVISGNTKYSFYKWEDLT